MIASEILRIKPAHTLVQFLPPTLSIAAGVIANPPPSVVNHPIISIGCGTIA